MPLLYVLWTVALLTIAAAAALSTSVISYRQAGNAAETARRSALAEAVLNRTVLALLDPREGKRPRIDGVPSGLNLDTIDFMVEIRDETERIDLNHADAPLLAWLFRRYGETAQDADRLADRVVDWRDADNLKHLNGAEAAEYENAGVIIRPRNAPFQSLEELKLVLGFKASLFQRIKRVITVYSGRPIVDPMATVSLVQRMLQRPNAAPASLKGRTFSISIDFRLGRGRVRRDAVIRLMESASHGYLLLDWR